MMSLIWAYGIKHLPVTQRNVDDSDIQRGGRTEFRRVALSASTHSIEVQYK